MLCLELGVSKVIASAHQGGGFFADGVVDILFLARTICFWDFTGKWVVAFGKLFYADEPCIFVILISVAAVLRLPIIFRGGLVISLRRRVL